MALNEAGYNTLTAANGPDGLAKAKAHLPDLILCDINLPSLSGLELLEQVRSTSGLSGIQFVLTTGHTRVNRPRAGMERGADDFLEKPFGLNTLLSCVRARLERAMLSERVSDSVVAELKSSLRSNLPHEFFTPLVGILGLGEILRDEWSQLSADEIDRYLHDILQSGQRLHRTLRNYLFALDLQAGTAAPPSQPVLAPSDLMPLLREVGCIVAKRHLRETDLILGEVNACVRMATADLELIVEELLDNAFTFSAPGSAVEIGLSEPGILTVRDHGRGMDAEQVKRVGAFRQFDRKKYEQQGLGLGLFLVSEIVRRYGLKLDIQSEPGSGTLVTLTFS